jgi:hypothetical protein
MSDDIVEDVFRAIMLNATFRGPAECADWGYYRIKPLPGGLWLGLQQMIFTTGLFVIEGELSWRLRFCYERRADAEAALEAWDGQGDPPGPWIKEKGSGRLNPNWLRETRAELQGD